MKPHLRKQHCCMIGQRIVHRHYVIDMAPHPSNTSPTQTPSTNLPKPTHSLTLQISLTPHNLPSASSTSYRLLSPPLSTTKPNTQHNPRSPNKLKPTTRFLVFFLSLLAKVAWCLQNTTDELNFQQVEPPQRHTHKHTQRV